MATLKNLTINDTGFLKVADGTTAQRPTPTNGDMRHNSTTGIMEMYVNGAWRSADGSLSAGSTGGSVTTAGGYRIHTFTTVGTATFNATYTGRAEVLVLAGGGGGGPIGGGGGAGGYIYNSNFPVIGGQNYTITVGGGGAGGFHHYSDEGRPGNPSSISGPSGSLTATGGGKGGFYANGTTVADMSGGSGGGGPGGTGSPGTDFSGRPGEHPGGTAIAGQGHPGGFGHHGSGPGYPNPGSQGSGGSYCGGGAGGAGSRGVSAYSNNSRRNGGFGLNSSITGTPVNYAFGGGGGSHQNPYGFAPAPSGAPDNQGRGGSDSGNTFATPGGTNRGGGGGGGGHPGGENPSGLGGPGIVVVRYRN